ncbi:MAG: non-heme iron oxygenase ferredoxin subunit [Thiobacillaceae bacterium]|jgi:3-phenylpropionate/trans-cinnamate dioxygenase ferredoxin subunit
MSDWTNVALVKDFPPGTCKVVDVDGVQVAVFNLHGQLHAIEDICTHDGGELASGELENEVIICPRHGARFSIITGEVLGPPAYEPVHVFPLRLEEGVIQIRDDRWG